MFSRSPSDSKVQVKLSRNEDLKRRAVVRGMVAVVLAAGMLAAATTGVAAGVLDGQLWFISNGGTTDAVAGHVNADGGNVTQAGQQNASDQSQTAAIDLAAGFYFTISNDHLTLQARSVTNPSAVVSSVKIGNDLNTPSTADDDIVNALALDPFTHTIYVGLWGQDLAHTGIVVVNYNTATGALDPNAAYGSGGVYDANTTYLITGASTGGKITDPRDFSIDLVNHKLYWTDDDNQYNFAPFVPTNNISVVTYNAANPSTTVAQLSSNVQFPTNQSNGIIGPMAADVAKGLIYFETNHIGNSAATLWWMPIAGGTATAVTLPGGSALGFGDVPQGGISIDPQSQYIFVTVQSGTLFAGPDEVLQGVLSADGHSITSWINTYPIATLFGQAPQSAQAHIADTAFDQLPTLTITATATHAAEQGGFVDLTASNTSTDTDGDHYASAKVQITGGTFVSNETSASDDHLSVLDGVTNRTSGVFTGTNITVAYTPATETLTLTGYDTIANYNTVLGHVQYNTTGNNPTNYGNNPSRTISWTVSDGALNIPFGAQNSAQTTLNIDAVNNAPVNVVPGAQSVPQNTDLAFAGVSVSDVDADPANQNIVMTLATTHGNVTVATNVGGGVTAGNVAGNSSHSVTLTATQNAINATLAAVNGLKYHGDLSYFGSDTLTVTSNDQGHTGSGGALQDQDTVNITVVAPPTIAFAFAPATIPLNTTTNLNFTLTNPNAATTLTGVAFTDTLPVGLSVTNASAPVCGGGTLTTTAATGVISLTGGSIGTGGSNTCQFSVTITGATAGVYSHTTGAVSSTNGGTGATSNSAPLTVVAPPTFGIGFNPTSVTVGASSTLTFTINNPNASTSLTGVGFSDTLPSGLAIATPNGLSGSCGSGTITATQNTIVVSLSGATLAQSAGCTFSVNVTATGAGSKINTTGAITSIEGGTGSTAMASLTVNKSSTTTTLTTACMTTFVANQSFTMTAAVTGFSPSGNSAFDDSAAPITGCTSVALSGGAANCITSTLAVGVRDLTASYGGDLNNLTSNSPSLFVTVLDPPDVIFRNGFEATIAGCPSE